MFCSACGNKLEEGARFCGKCGAKVETDLTPPSPQKTPKPKSQRPTGGFDTRDIPNPEHGYANIGLAISGVAVLMMAAGITGMVDMMNGGGALILIGFFLLIMGFVVFGIYKKRARLLDTILKGDEVLARWQYSATEWRRFTEEAFADRKANNKAMFILIAVIMVVVVLGLLIATGFDEASIIVAIGMAGFLAFLALIAVLTVWLPYRRRSQIEQGRVLIAQRGLWVEGDFHEWVTLGNRLEAVVYEVDEQRLVVQYSSINRTGRIYQTVLLPVPEGQEASADELIAYFGKNQLVEEPEEDAEEEA